MTEVKNGEFANTLDSSFAMIITDESTAASWLLPFMHMNEKTLAPNISDLDESDITNLNLHTPEGKKILNAFSEYAPEAVAAFFQNQEYWKGITPEPWAEYRHQRFPTLDKLTHLNEDAKRQLLLESILKSKYRLLLDEERGRRLDPTFQNTQVNKDRINQLDSFANHLTQRATTAQDIPSI